MGRLGGVGAKTASVVWKMGGVVETIDKSIINLCMYAHVAVPELIGPDGARIIQIQLSFDVYIVVSARIVARRLRRRLLG